MAVVVSRRQKSAGESEKKMGTAVGQWLEEALVDLCQKTETGLNFDRDVISGLVSYCDLAQPVDAKEYLDVIFLPSSP